MPGAGDLPGQSVGVVVVTGCPPGLSPGRAIACLLHGRWLVRLGNADGLRQSWWAIRGSNQLDGESVRTHWE